MKISISATRPQSLSTAETAVIAERETIYSTVFEVARQAITLNGQELGNKLIRTMEIFPSGQIIIKPRDWKSFTDPDQWFHQAIPKNSQKRTEMNAFKPVRRRLDSKSNGFLGFWISRVQQENVGAIIVGPDDYQIRIEWE